MKLLLDTHTALWLDSAPEKLSATALRACEDPSNELFLSVVSAWEIQIKCQLGRLELAIPLETMIDGLREHGGINILNVELRHIYALQSLPLIHNDPFDRLLIAQASCEGCALVSVDQTFDKYRVDVVR